MNKLKLKSKAFWLSSILAIILIASIIVVCVASCSKQVKVIEDTVTNVKQEHESIKEKLSAPDIDKNLFKNKELIVKDKFSLYENLTDFVEKDNVSCNFEPTLIKNNLLDFSRGLILNNYSNQDKQKIEANGLLMYIKYKLINSIELWVDLRWYFNDKNKDVYTYDLFSLKLT